jgi:hypothetical protein
MNRATSRILFLAGLAIVVIGFAVAGAFPGPGPFQLLAAGVGGVLCAIGYIGALVTLARLNQWLWFGLLLLLPPITMLVYVLAGPTTPAGTTPAPAMFAGTMAARSEQILPASLKGGIFLSYRREDSADICGRIYDHLVARYGKLKVFKDVDNIPYGADFPSYIQAQLRECTVCLVVMGQRWLTSASATGQRRLDDPGDFVRLEIEGALRQGLAVIPVMVHGAALPPAGVLPESLGPLRFLNAAPVRLDPDFATDVRRLCDSIDRLALRPSVV